LERDEAAFAAGWDAAHADMAAGLLIYRGSGHADHCGHWMVIQWPEHFSVAVEGFGICFQMSGTAKGS
jgi:hypothetical protein